MRESLLVGEFHLDRDTAVVVDLKLLLVDQRIEFEQRILIYMGVDIDRIDGGDGGQERSDAGDTIHVIPLGQQRPTHPPVNGRTNPGVIQIELRGISNRLGGQ